MAINSLSASSHGLSGLVSGIDSQQVVQKMLSGTQAKIDKATQKKSVLQSKQQMYRDVVAKLTTLQTSFLSFTSKSNLLSNSFYNNMKTAITPPAGLTAAFSVTGSSSAKPGTVTMDYIEKLATARTAKTQVPASGTVTGALSQVAAKELLKEYEGPNATLKIKVGETVVEFADAAKTFGGKNPTEVVEILNAKLKDAGAEARFINNKLQIKAQDPQKSISIYGNKAEGATALATKMFGVPDIGGQGVINATIDTDAYLPSFEIDLDGRKQSIRVDIGLLRNYAGATGETNIQSAREALVDGINAQMTRYFGTGAQMKLDNNSGTVSIVSGAVSQKVSITGDYKMMETLGIKSGMSNKLNTGLMLKDLNFKESLNGNQYTFKINGVEFSFSGETSLSTVMNEVNNSKAGVKISYLESEDRFVMQSSATGAGSEDFTKPGAITQSEGNLMSVLFGIKGSGKALGEGIIVDMTSKTKVEVKDIQDGGTFTFNINGVDHKIKISRDKDSDPFTLETFAKEMNKSFENTFGKMTNGTQKLEFINKDGYFTIRANDKNMSVKATQTDKNNNTNMLGFTEGQTNTAQSGSATLADAGIRFGNKSGLTIRMGAITYTDGGVEKTINAQDIELSADELNGAASMDDLARIVNEKVLSKYPSAVLGKLPTLSFDAHSGGFQLLGVEIPMEIMVKKGADDADKQSTNLDNLFGKMPLGVGKTPEFGGTEQFFKQSDEGSNAIFSINGSRMERASNSFTIEGLTYTLTDTTVTKRDNDGKPIEYQPSSKITVTRDTDQIVNGIQDFLKMYNETIDFINGIYKANSTYKDYPPLTAEQKKNMSDREVEQWEEKSKEGLLRNDPLLDRILSSLRSGMYTKPEESTIAIYNLGISTSFYSNDGNFSAKNADDLRAAIEANPDSVRQLFAGTGGIMTLVNDAINTATKSSFASPGYITAMAGSSALDTTSSIYKQIKDIDTQLGVMEKRYWSEYNRYWKQFNSMEQMIQKMNTQSSWLTQQFQ